MTFYLFPNALSQVEFQYYHQDQINGYRTQDYPDYGNEPVTHFARRNFFEDYNEYVDDFNECRCLCDTCVDLQPCCRSVCVNCVTPQSSVMFVPYVYPIIVTKNEEESHKETTISTTATTLTTTTTIATTKVEATTEITTTRQNELDNINVLSGPKLSEIEMKFASAAEVPKTVITGVGKGPYQFIDKNSKYVMTSLRRTKTNWLPKYGIVPIPDQLAEKILLQLRNMKVLHPSHNDMRTMDFLNKYKS